MSYDIVSQKIVAALGEDGVELCKVTPVSVPGTLWELKLLHNDGSYRTSVCSAEELLAIYDVLRAVVLE